MSGKEKTVVITGANAGIGYQVALAFCQQGARVVMACRSKDKAEQARSELLEQVPAGNIDILPLDVSELSSINEFARQFADEIGELDILINNAGIVTPHLHRNSLGYELHLATNYLGAFAVTGLLLPFFKSSRQTRIVNVGSLAHRFGKFDFNDPNWNQRKFNHWKAYAQSKIATASFTQELNRRLQLTGSDTIALGAHPGFAATDMGRKTGATTPSTRFGQWYQNKMEAWIVGPPNQAAQPILYAASENGVEGGDYYGPTGWFEIKGKPGPARINPLAKNVEFGKRIWAISESLTGVSYLADLETKSNSLESGC
ncbi:oxidoreductase [Ketobacter sp.]|uniref:oxidoreductase n=1 Tax=Ketobacter sp. TaxID=2083498 RepID=UPI000F26BEBD|nr:oxidoreductase [Ketobacter sp.]RLT98737.1 MAG: SDR family NAD(P)-dependent oxidoreductase [Ketobacter sp.]